MKTSDKKNIAKYIDHTNIRKEATSKDIIKTCEEAKKYGFRGVCINPKWVKLVSKELEGTDIKTVVLIDPPMGLSSHEQRMKWCKKAKKDGADDLDIVMTGFYTKENRLYSGIFLNTGNNTFIEEESNLVRVNQSSIDKL